MTQPHQDVLGLAVQQVRYRMHVRSCKCVCVCVWTIWKDVKLLRSVIPGASPLEPIGDSWCLTTWTYRWFLVSHPMNPLVIPGVSPPEPIGDSWCLTIWTCGDSWCLASTAGGQWISCHPLPNEDGGVRLCKRTCNLNLSVIPGVSPCEPIGDSWCLTTWTIGDSWRLTIWTFRDFPTDLLSFFPLSWFWKLLILNIVFKARTKSSRCKCVHWCRSPTWWYQPFEGNTLPGCIADSTWLRNLQILNGNSFK